MVYIMAVFYVFAGVMHFVKPKIYLRIMPPFVPYHKVMVALSGIVESGFGFLLLFPESRPFAAWGIILLLIFIFPANIYQLTSTIKWKKASGTDQKRRSIPVWILFMRLPLQFVLIYWAWVYT